MTNKGFKFKIMDIICENPLKKSFRGIDLKILENLKNTNML